MSEGLTGEKAVLVQASLAVVLTVAAIGVRGLPPSDPPRPVETPDDPVQILEPMQLLRGAGVQRLAEIDPFVSDEQHSAWVDSRAVLGRLEGCPDLSDWIALPEGQRLERTLPQLRKGSREEALGALALVFRIAGATDWLPGNFGGPEDAEILGALLQAWIEDWGEEAAVDPQLYQPSLAAVLLYGRVMQSAFKAGVFGDSERSLERARAFLGRALWEPSGARTRLGELFEAHHPGAVPPDLEGEGFLKGISEEAKLLFPELDGECGD